MIVQQDLIYCFEKLSSLACMMNCIEQGNKSPGTIEGKRGGGGTQQGFSKVGLDYPQPDRYRP